MRIQFIIIFILFSFKAFSHDEAAIQELMKKYHSVMEEKKTELIDEVFTKNFIQDNGGKQQLIKKINALPMSLDSHKIDYKFSKAEKKKIYLVKMSPKKDSKTGKSTASSEFMVIRESGKLKIDGTLGDTDEN